jgi:hypothetical protein
MVSVSGRVSISRELPDLPDLEARRPFFDFIVLSDFFAGASEAKRPTIAPHNASRQSWFQLRGKVISRPSGPIGISESLGFA